jgi:hypothetical protein
MNEALHSCGTSHFLNLRRHCADRAGTHANDDVAVIRIVKNSLRHALNFIYKNGFNFAGDA